MYELNRHSIGLLYVFIFVCIWSCTVSAESENWDARAAYLRDEIAKVLTLPESKVALDAKVHRRLECGEYSIEALTYASEAGSRVTASLYLPKNTAEPVPAVIVACGHGGSKSCFYAQYAGQLYAQLGFACLIPDTIGEEEREATGRMGARGHDLYPLKDKNPEYIHTQVKRSVLGKIVWDLLCGLDYLETRTEIDKDRIGIVGYSLGGATSGIVSMLDQRIKAAVICGWVFRERYAVASKYCTKLPHAAFNRFLNYGEMTALSAPHAASLYFCGERDNIIDDQLEGAAVVRDLKANVSAAHGILDKAGQSGTIEVELVPESGHRPFFLSERAVCWMQEYLMGANPPKAIPAKRIYFGDWVDSQGKQIESLYNTERNERGLLAIDCGAVYREPKELACFPDVDKPEPETTMKGWCELKIAENRTTVPGPLKKWMAPQNWIRDKDCPVISLGEKGRFDDTHLFAPAVLYENGRYEMLYCGSRGSVDNRIFHLGYAVSANGVDFEKFEESPVYGYGDGRRSILTPTFLRGDEGRTLRENGLLRLWFSSADMTVRDAAHTLHECSGRDVLHLSSPSPSQLENVYAPTIIKEDDICRLWYTDVSTDPWTFRHAFSRDGQSWFVTEGPVLVIDQDWERDRLFYPTVVKSGDVYLMWYGAYWKGHEQMTALGFAASRDGVIWYKHPENPVFRPEPRNSWESHYTTSQSVMRLDDGTWRMWYATRKEPPHVNKYFAIGTAAWIGPAE